MIKATLVSIGILILCGLENIGHYFGICFHGYTAQLIGCLSGAAFGIAMYFKNLQIWFLSRKEGKPHQCNPRNHMHE